MNEENNMDLLDLDVDDGASMDALPDVAPLTSPRPRKPWLLLGVGLLIIILATYIIVRAVSRDDGASVDVDLDAPTVVVDGGDAMNVNPNPMPGDMMMPPAPPVMQGDMNNMPPVPGPMPVPVAEPVQPEPVVVPDAVQQPDAGMPVRVIEDRKDVVFNPNKVEKAPAPVEKPAVKPAAKKATPKAAVKSAPKPQVAPKGSWYVQFGSYSTRASAEAAERKIRNAHSGLFQGKQFVILAAVLPNGQTTYRLRIAFTSSADANGFCRNAKSDGLDCYVAK